MKGAIFSFVRVSDNSMVASVRIARYIMNMIGLPIIADDSIRDEKLDLLIIVNGAYGFCRHLPALADAVRTARRIVWVQNDYTIIPPKIESKGVSPFRESFRTRHERGLPHMDFWTTCERWQNKTPGSMYVNWNSLTFDPTYDEKNIRTRRARSASDLLYYGSYRGGGGRSSRQRYFDRYFTSPEVTTTISSPARQFQENYKSPLIKYDGPIIDKFYETIGKHGLGLYIEDRMSHDEFHSPANRFYEMLSAGLPMVFAPECGTMLRRAGFDPSPYQVEKPRDVLRFMKNREDVGDQQRRDWAGLPFKGLLDEKLMNAYQFQLDELAVEDVS